MARTLASAIILLIASEFLEIRWQVIVRGKPRKGTYLLFLFSCFSDGCFLPAYALHIWRKSENNKYFLKITAPMERYHIGSCGTHLVLDLTDEN